MRKARFLNEEGEREMSTWPPTMAMAGGEPSSVGRATPSPTAGHLASPHLHVLISSPVPPLATPPNLALPTRFLLHAEELRAEYEIGAGASGEWVGTRETSARRMPRAASEGMKTGGQDRVDDSREIFLEESPGAAGGAEKFRLMQRRHGSPVRHGEGVAPQTVRWISWEPN